MIEGGRLRPIAPRDAVNLEIFWLKDKSMEELADVPASHIVARVNTDSLEMALEQFAAVAKDVA